MAGTGRTQHYDIPIYNAGDTVNDLNTYNNAMEIIDTQLDTVDTLATANQEEFTSLNAQVQKQQGDITKLQEGVVNAQGTANGALAQIQELVNPDTIRFSPMANVTDLANAYRNDLLIQMPNSFHMKTAAGLQTTMTVGGATYYIYGKIDNANPFRLSTGTIFGFGAFAYFRSKTSHQVEFPQLMTATLHYDGINTYVMISSDLSFNSDNYTETIVKVYDDIKLFNGQPKQNLE